MAGKVSRGYDFMPETTGADKAGILATGIGVAVIDSGITPNLDLTDNSGKSRIVYQESFVPGTTDPRDYYGHGTHVAGTIAGNGASSQGKQFVYNITGVATNADLINLRVLDQNGTGSDAQVIAAIQRAISLKSLYNIRVINLSLGNRFLKATPLILCVRR